MSGRSDGPLHGLLVVDLTRLLPGGYCTQLLADLGADVLKVEPRRTGDEVRWAPPLASTGESGAHLVLNRGKRSMTLDLKTADGRALLLDLAARADVLVESFRPGVMERLGVGRDVLLDASPRLVYVAISAFGRGGPLEQVPGHDIDAQAYAGALSLGRGADGGPAVPYLQVADLAAGLQAALGALAALHARDAGRRPAGQAVDVAMTDAVASLLTLAAGAYAAGGGVPTVREPLTGALACYGTYRCGDGRYVAVGALEPKFFARLCALLERAELASLQYDPAGQGELRAALAAVFEQRSRDEWTSLLGGEDTCLAPVLDVAEALAHPDVRARGVVEDHRLADGTAFPRVGPVLRLSGTPARPGASAPGLGEHTDEVLDWLGRDPAQVADLRAREVV